MHVCVYVCMYVCVFVVMGSVTPEWRRKVETGEYQRQCRALKKGLCDTWAENQQRPCFTETTPERISEIEGNRQITEYFTNVTFIFCSHLICTSLCQMFYPSVFSVFMGSV